MWLKRLALVAILGIVVLASCARTAFHIGSEIQREVITELNFDEDIHVTKRVGDKVVIDEMMNFSDLERLEDDDMDLENVTFSLNASEDGLSLQVNGTDKGDDVVISADFNHDGSSIKIELEE